MIVLVISSLGIGGAQVWVKNLARILAPSFDVEIVYGGLYGGISRDDALRLVDGFALAHIPGLHIPFNPLAAVRAYRYLKSRPEATLIVSSFAAGVNIRLAALLTGNVVYYVSHGWSFRYQGYPSAILAKRAERLFGRHSKVVCVSHADFEHARDALRIPASNLALIRNRILGDYDTRESDGAVRGGAVRRVLYVGRNAKPKRFDLYVALSKRFPSIEFHAVGPMPGDFAVLPETIVLHGRVADFSNYDEYDVFCLFSDSEGLPMSALEAHARGVPLVLSNVGGCAELIRKNGLLVENDINDISAKFRRIVDDIASFRRYASRDRGRFIASPASIRRLVGRIRTGMA